VAYKQGLIKKGEKPSIKENTTTVGREGDTISRFLFLEISGKMSRGEEGG